MTTWGPAHTFPVRQIFGLPFIWKIFNKYRKIDPQIFYKIRAVSKLDISYSKPKKDFIAFRDLNLQVDDPGSLQLYMQSRRFGLPTANKVHVMD